MNNLSSDINSKTLTEISLIIFQIVLFLRIRYKFVQNQLVLRTFRVAQKVYNCRLFWDFVSQISVITEHSCLAVIKIQTPGFYNLINVGHVKKT